MKKYAWSYGAHAGSPIRRRFLLLLLPFPPPLLHSAFCLLPFPTPRHSACARAARGCSATDAAAEMPRLRREPEEVKVASGVLAMGTLGCGGPQRVRRQNAYATLCANFL
jgi:hypothetical protein